MGIPHDHGNGFPSSEFLHGVNIDSGLHKTGGEGMAQIVKTKVFHVCLSHDSKEPAKHLSRIHPVARTLAELVIAFDRAHLAVRLLPAGVFAWTKSLFVAPLFVSVESDPSPIPSKRSGDDLGSSLQVASFRSCKPAQKVGTHLLTIRHCTSAGKSAKRRMNAAGVGGIGVGELHLG